MAITPTKLAQVSVASSIGTAAWTASGNNVTAGDLILVCVGAMGENVIAIGDDLTVTDSNTNTYTRIGFGNQAASTYLFEGAAFYAIAATTNASLTITMDCGAVNINCSSYTIWKMTGYNAATPIGGKVFVAQNTVFDGAYSITLDAAPAATDTVFAHISIDGDNSGTVAVTAGTGWTADGTVGSTGTANIAQAQHITGVTSTAVAWVDIRAGTMSTGSTFACGVVIKAAAGSAQALTGSSAGLATTTATMAIAEPLAGTTAGTSTTTGALAVVAGGTLAGTSTGLATTTGALAVARALAGTSAGSSTATGAFPSAFLFPATISGRNVLDQNGNPWIAVGEAAWSLIVQLTNTQQDQYLTDRAAKGYRALIVNLIEHSFSSHSPAWRDSDGNLPFTGTAFQSTLTPAYWTRVDRVIAKCASLGITVFAWPAYLGWTGSEDGWDTEVAAATNAQMTTYGATLKARYASSTNIVWIGSGDTDGDSTTRARTDAMMTAIAPTIGSVHGVGETDTETNWGAYTWNTMRSVYANTNKQPVLWSETIRAHTPPKPIWFVEGDYEYEDGTGSAMIHRNQLWGTMLEGCFIAFTGNNPIWSFEAGNRPFQSEPPAAYDTWPEALNSPLVANVQRLLAFIARYLPARWTTMVPGVNFVTTGEGSFDTKAGVAVDQANGNALVYFPTSRSITLAMSVFTPTSIRLRWYDPTAGTYTDIGTYPNTGTRSPAYPSSNSAGGADWVLVADNATGGMILNQAAALRVGTATATKAYVGTVQVWP